MTTVDSDSSSLVHYERRSWKVAMCMIGFTLFAMAVGVGSSLAEVLPAVDQTEPSTTVNDALSGLFVSLEGATCQGAMVLYKVASRDPPVSTPLRMSWFRGSDGNAWVNFKYGSRDPVLRPAHDTPGGMTFYGAFGQPFTLHGTSAELTGATYAEDAAGTVHVTCFKDPAAPAATHPLPADPVRLYDITSKLNGQTYRLLVRLPVEPAPAGGYPVLYVLDGNYYFGTVSDEAQRMIAQRIVKPFVVVAVGYPTDDRGEQGGRRDFDLTLPVPVLVGRYGGVDTFLHVLDEELRPFIAVHVPVSSSEQALYGHSFGGLAALRELFRHSDAFSVYVLSSPSIWWADKAVLADEAAFSQQVRVGKVHARILITSAGDEQRADIPGGDREAAVHRMVDNASDLANRLAALNPQQMPVSRVIFPDEVHGSVSQASTSRAVRFSFPPR